MLIVGLSMLITRLSTKISINFAVGFKDAELRP